jgi:hypothetical protein
MPADFISEPPADGLFEATEPEPSTPPDNAFLSSLIINGDDLEGLENPEG